MRTRVFFMTPNMLLVFAWARFKPARMYSLRLLATRHCFKSNTGYVLPCNMCTVIQRMWEMNVQIMPLRVVLSAWFRVITFPHVGRITLLIPLHVLLPGATLVVSWKNCVTLEQRWSRILSTRTGASALFLIGFSVVRTHASHVFISQPFLFRSLS